MDIEPDFSMRKVEEVVKVSKKKKKKFDDVGDIIKDGHNWMSDFDRKILGLGSGANAPVTKKNTVKNEDEIQFCLDPLEKE